MEGSNDEGVKETWLDKLISRIRNFGVAATTNELDQLCKPIHDLIDVKKFHNAIKKLIAIENIDSDDVLSDYKNKINFAYETLEKEMFKVILHSIDKDLDENVLIQVIKAIKEQEREDSKILRKEGEHNQHIPREWKKKWRKWIEESVSQQMAKAQVSTDKDLSENVLNLGKRLKNDLVYVIKNLNKSYPTEFNVCNVYLQCYHKCLMSEMASITERNLNDEDTYFLLCWINDIYPQTILGDPLIQGHIDVSGLESLLPPRTIRKLDRAYLEYEKDKLETLLNKSLNLEVNRWNDGKEPTQEGRCYLSKLQKDVTMIFKGSIQRTANISETMSLQMAPILGAKLQQLLTSYHSLVVDYTLKKKKKCFRSITIANINCILAFRNLLESNDLRISSTMKEKLNCDFQEFETLGYKALLQDLFKKLKSQFKKLHHRKDKKQKFPDILDYVKSYVSSLKPLRPACFQVVINMIHFQVVLEYITQVMENPVRLENSDQLKFTATRMTKNANKMKWYFESQGSQETWLYPLFYQLAEILKAEKKQDTINNICTLAERYTDISRDHIAAILHIKGNIDILEAESALDEIEDRITVRAKVGTSPPLFSRITPFSSDWLVCSSRRHHPESCCLNFSDFIKFTCNTFIHLCCRKLNVDTPPKYYPHKAKLELMHTISRTRRRYRRVYKAKDA